MDQEAAVVESKEKPAFKEKVKVFFENHYFDTSVFELKDLKAGQILTGEFFDYVLSSKFESQSFHFKSLN